MNGKDLKKESILFKIKFYLLSTNKSKKLSKISEFGGGIELRKSLGFVPENIKYCLKCI